MSEAARQRFEMPPRREAQIVEWTEIVGTREHSFTVGFGWDFRGHITEAFCSGQKEGSDLRAAVQDGCILLSHCLQRGASIVELAAALGEDRAEASPSGPPASFLGAIARRGAILERGARTYICPRTEERCSVFQGHLVCDCDVKGVAR